MILNGCLAGLVAITAPCAFVSVGSAAVIGLIAGALAVAAVLWFDRRKIDDAVGALSVHLVNGVFGTLAVGIFAEDRIMPNTTGDGLLFGGGPGLLWHQFVGVAAVAAFTFSASVAVWKAIEATVGLRVSPDEEMRGLDIGEHGMEAYSGFQIFTTQ
jgi:Amt family ammonium transporter